VPILILGRKFKNSVFCAAMEIYEQAHQRALKMIEEGIATREYLPTSPQQQSALPAEVQSPQFSC
jgi:hypothetical protein